MKYANLCIIQDSEGEENEGEKKMKGRKKSVKIMAQYFPNLMKTINS